MDTRLTHKKLVTDLKNSIKILIGLSILSAFGILSGISVYILDNIWINIPNNYPVFIFSASAILLTISYFTYKNTQRLSEAVMAVKIET
jgi:hypothetical protein